MKTPWTLSEISFRTSLFLDVRLLTIVNTHFILSTTVMENDTFPSSLQECFTYWKTCYCISFLDLSSFLLLFPV